MKSAQALLAAVMAFSLAGCILRGKQTAKNLPPPPRPATMPAPSAPRQLSIEQTQVELPPPQPVSPEALATTQEPAVPEESAPPARPVRRQHGPVGPQPKAEPAPAQAPATPPADAEPQRPALGEIVPAEEQKRLQASVLEDRRVTRQLVEQAQARGGLSQVDQNRVKRIQEFLKLSEEAQAGGNMRQASELAHRGLILARELQVAR